MSDFFKKAVDSVKSNFRETIVHRPFTSGFLVLIGYVLNIWPL